METISAMEPLEDTNKIILQPLQRAVTDEKQDFDDAVANLLRGAYREWPNEAGFEGLKEERGPIEVPVVGSIPAWAAGSLYRTGPGQMSIENTPKGTHHIQHWFDGLAHAHRFDIVPVAAADGSEGSVKVLYSSRRQSEALAKHIQAYGPGRLMSFGQRRDPCIGLLGKFMTVFQTVLEKKLGIFKRSLETENVSVCVLDDLPGFITKEGLAEAEAEAKRKAEGEEEGKGEGKADEVDLPKTAWLTTDTWVLKQIDPRTLEPIGATSQVALHPDLTGPMSSAHAQRCPDTGDLFNFNTELARYPTYRVFRVSAATGKTDILATFGGPHVAAAYQHSFYLTQKYVVICLPVAHFALGGLKVLWERNVVESIEPFDASKKYQWFVIDRHHGKGVVAELESDAAFYFHTVNAFDEEDENGEESVVCDVIEYPSFDVVRTLYVDSLLNRNGAADVYMGDAAKAPALVPSLVRYRLPLALPSARSSLDTEKPDRPPAPPPASPANQPPRRGRAERVSAVRGPHAGELPTINPARATRRHRFVYGLANRGLSTLVDTLVKTDADTGAAVLWNNPHGHTPGEAIFVARPGAEDEDDGVLLSLVLDGVAGTSYLLCLDARTMGELGRAEPGFAIAMGFHGMHRKGVR